MWLGGTLLLPSSERVPVLVAGELAHCWVLRRHLLGVVLGAALGLAGLTHDYFVWWRQRVGVWLCVECCIVDASILLWSSV